MKVFWWTLTRKVTFHIRMPSLYQGIGAGHHARWRPELACLPLGPPTSPSNTSIGALHNHDIASYLLPSKYISPTLISLSKNMGIFLKIMADGKIHPPIEERQFSGRSFLPERTATNMADLGGRSMKGGTARFKVMRLDLKKKGL